MASAGVVLPVVKTLPDCGDFALTVAPYFYQLIDLPKRYFDLFESLDGPKEVYLSTNPLITAFAISIFLAPIFLAVSEINKNYSQVDRLWSILPTFYIAHYVTWAHLVGLPTQRLDYLMVFSVVWSVRWSPFVLEDHADTTRYA